MLLCSVLVLFCVAAARAAAPSEPLWDASYRDARFAQRYRIGAGGTVQAESTVAVNVAAARLRPELAGPWAWWTGGAVVVSSPAPPRGAAFTLYPTGRYFHALLTLQPAHDGPAGGFSIAATSAGMVEGPWSIHVAPHPAIVNRSMVTVRLEGVRSNTMLLGPDSLARGLLWAMRGDLGWPFEHVRGFNGLIRKLEGQLALRHDVLDEAQLDGWVADAPEALLWAPRLDTSAGELPYVMARDGADFAAVLSQSDPAHNRSFHLQFLLHSDDEDSEYLEADDVVVSPGWSVPGSALRVSFLRADGEDTGLTLSIDDKAAADGTRAVHLQVSPVGTADEEGSALRSTREIVMGRIPPSPPGQARHLSLTVGANWTLSLAVDQLAPWHVVVPEALREELRHSVGIVAGVGLRYDASSRRATLGSLLLTSDAQLHRDVGHFLRNRAASTRDAYSLGTGVSSPSGMFVAVQAPMGWTSLSLWIVALVGLPLLVARLASFDTSLLPTKGLERPLLYVRLATTVTVSTSAAAAVAVLCLVIHLVFHAQRGFPSVAAALTHRSPEVLLWRLIVCVVAVKRLLESYLLFKIQIDALSEKKSRVAKPLFDFDYWMWMNRVSLVADVLETLSLLVVSLCSPVENAELQRVGSILFGLFHVIHIVAHFRIFAELKRVRQDELVDRFRSLLSAAVGVLLSCAVFHLLRAAMVGWLWLESLAHVAEWAFFAVSFVWRWLLLSQFMQPEDTRLYLGRRVALGAATRCSECFRPFSQSRARSSCADCRDECCSECGTEVHLSDLGSDLLDMTCFFCNKCYLLLSHEVARARSKLDPKSPRATRSTRTAVPSAPGAAPGAPRSKRGEGTSRSLENSASTLAPVVIEHCRMFQRGECTYGDTCKFVHIEDRRRRDQARGDSMTAAVATASAAAAPGSSTLRRRNITPNTSPHSVARKPHAQATSESESGMQPMASPPPLRAVPTSYAHAVRRDAPEVAAGDGTEPEAPGHMSNSSTASITESSGAIAFLKKRRRGKRGQRKKRTGGATDTDGGTEADADSGEDDVGDDGDRERADQ